MHQTYQRRRTVPRRFCWPASNLDSIAWAVVLSTVQISTLSSSVSAWSPSAPRPALACRLSELGQLSIPHATQAPPSLLDPLHPSSLSTSGMTHCVVTHCVHPTPAVRLLLCPPPWVATGGDPWRVPLDHLAQRLGTPAHRIMSPTCPSSHTLLPYT